MNQDEVSIWLSSIGLERYDQMFASSGIDSLRLVKRVRRKDLNKMGIAAPFHQDLIIREAGKLMVDEPSSEVRIQLKNLSSNCISFVLPWTTSIDELKLKIERDWLGIEPVHQKLICKGRQLVSGSLMENELSPHNTIFVVIDPTAALCTMFSSSLSLSPVPFTSSPPSVSVDSLCRGLSSLMLAKSDSVVVHFVRTAKEIEIVCCPETTTIGQLKNQLSCFDFPADNLLILLNCRVCEDDDALIRSYGYKHGEKIYVVVRD